MMSTIPRSKSFLFPLLFTIQFAFCAESHAQVDTETIKVGYFYYLDSVKVAPLVKAIYDELGITVETKRYVDNDSIIAGFRANEIDLFYFNSFGYILTKDEVSDLVPVLVGGTKKSTVSSYQSVVVANKEAPYHTIEELAQSNKEIDVSFGQPLSTSSHLVPRAYIKKIGLDPMFGTERFENTQREAIQSVITGKSEIGACGKHILIREGLEDQIKIIWTSTPIPQGPWATQPKNVEKVQPILKFLSEMHKKNPDTFNHIRENWGLPRSTRFVQVTDETYDGMREIFTSVDELKVMLDFYQFDMQD